MDNVPRSSQPQTHKELKLVMTPVGEASQISLPRFLEHILPPLQRDLNSSSIVEALKKGSTRKPITLRNRWRGFAQDPATSSRRAYASFRPLEEVTKTICAAAKPNVNGMVSPLRFQNNTHPVMKYKDRRNSDTFPDAYVTCTDRRGLSWSSMAVCGEYRKNDSDIDVNENIAKITSSLSHCMRNDPRRRFVFGFTIENTSMKFWFCDRSQIIVSEPFNFISEHIHVVHFFLSVLYAEPQQLGWDSTMIPLPDEKNYDITVHCGGVSKVYRTLELLSDSGAQKIRSRGTRVWKAVALENGKECGEPVALKDCWVQSQLTPEGKTLESILADAQTSEYHSFRDLTFLSVRCHGYVYLDDQRKTPDCTRSGWSIADELAMNDTTRNKTSTGQKVDNHYRIVFAQVCRPINRESSLSNIFLGLARIACALQLMHTGGWVHRDVSVANILVEGDNNARLTDLEYARKVGHGKEGRIGTSYFMSVEVDSQEYYFAVPEEGLFTRETIPFDLYDLLLGKIPASEIPPMVSHEWKPRTIVFQYNPLHDMESLWWVAMYFIFKREIVPPPSSVPPDSEPWSPEAQRDFANRLFYDQASRYDAITNNSFVYKIKFLHPLMQPLGMGLEHLRQKLVEHYTQAEVDITGANPRCADGLHEEFMNVFLRIAEAKNMKNIKFRPVHSTESGPLCVDRPVIDHGNEAINPVAAQSIPRRRSINEVEDTVHNADSSGTPSKRPKLSVPLRSAKANAGTHRYNLRPRRRD